MKPELSFGEQYMCIHNYGDRCIIFVLQLLLSSTYFFSASNDVRRVHGQHFILGVSELFFYLILMIIAAR